MQGGLVKAGLDVAQIWLDGDETLVNTIDRDGNMFPINMVHGHAKTHDPLVVLVSLVHTILSFRFKTYYSFYLLRSLENKLSRLTSIRMVLSSNNFMI